MNLNALPKIENHLHLEGAIPLEALWQLIQKYGGDASVTSLNQLKSKFQYRDFNHFIETWFWKNQFIREYEDFTFLSDAVFTDLVSQNVKYAEIFFSPSSFTKTLKIEKIVEAIAVSIKKNNALKVNLIVDLVRNYGAQNEMRTLHEVNEVKHFGIIGIGIGGSEKEYPPELFSEVFLQAKKYGFRTTAHAGENAGPESIWNAIRKLEVDRIGHGTNAMSDPELLKYLALHKIPIELCPLSNVRTKVISHIKDHPIRTFLEMGIPISINTDDPKMFNNTLVEEYQAVQEHFNFSDEDLCQIIIDSIHTTWLEEHEKNELIATFQTEMDSIKRVQS